RRGGGVMNCRWVRRRFSDHRDGALDAEEARALSSHLDACAACVSAWRSFNADLDLLGALPPVEAPGEVAARVFDRLDMERRQPGLSLLFRPLGAARPLMLPSLVPAALVLVRVLTGALVLARGPGPMPTVSLAAPAPSWPALLPPSGTEGNPLFAMSEVSPPRVRSGEVVPSWLLEKGAQGTVFIETVVARDGSVSAVTGIGGGPDMAPPAGG